MVRQLVQVKIRSRRGVTVGERMFADNKTKCGFQIYYIMLILYITNIYIYIHR